jgi:hypothetical protein
MVTVILSVCLSLSLPPSLSHTHTHTCPSFVLFPFFPAFYGTRKFITVFTRDLHWSLSWARWIQSIPSYLSHIYFNICHLPTPWSSQWPLSFWLYHRYSICIPLLPIRAPCLAHLILFGLIILITVCTKPAYINMNWKVKRLTSTCKLH